MKRVAGGVTAARGFLAAGTSAGIKRGRKRDMALVVSMVPASAAGTLTQNRVKAAPVRISQARLRTGVARAVLLNSGCANCLTGRRGFRDAMALSRAAAQTLGIPERQVLIASTGLIGTWLPVPAMQRAIPRLVGSLKRSGHHHAALGILTTDQVAKEAAVAARVGRHVIHLGGMAKGSGMIAPTMATMLCVLTTDAVVAPTLLREMLIEAVEGSFNRISVDGDMSTNDSVFALANGASGVVVRRGTVAARTLVRMLQAVSADLARRIVKDGEGALRVMDIEVIGARSMRDARACARQVATSPLVKTMLGGREPNVGRIAAAIGASSAQVNPDRMDVYLGSHRVITRNAVCRLDRHAWRRLLANGQLTVRIQLHAGRASWHMTTCDLTEAYVRINAGYAT